MSAMPTESPTSSDTVAEAKTPWLNRLHWLGVDLRPEETRLVGGLFLASFFLGVFQFSSKAVRQAGYIDQFGADRLPYVYLAVAISAYPVLRLYGVIADRWSPLAVISTTLGIIVAGLIGFWWLMAAPPWWVPVAYYVWVAIATALALTQLWSLTNTYLNARQARRLFGLIGAGSLLGGVIGGQVASLSRNEPRNALLAAAAMLLLMIYIVYRLDRSQGRGTTLTGEMLRPSKRLANGSSREDAGNRSKLDADLADADEDRPRGLEVLASSNHLRLIAGILLITVIVAQIIDLQFSWVIENTRDSYAGRVSAFGNVFSLMGLAAFIFQLVLTPRIHRSFGVGHAMRVLPGFIALGSVALLLAASFTPATLILVVGFLRIGDNGLRYSLDHVTRELLFVPVPAAQRVEAKGYVDVFVHRFGKALGAVLLLAVTFGWVSVLQMTWATLVLVLLWMLLTVRAKQHYVEALRRGLSEGEAWHVTNDNADDLAIDPNDVNTLELLMEALGSPDPSRVVGSLELLRTHGRAKLVPPLLLYHDDEQVRRVTLEVLMEAERRDALPLIERCVGDSDADVRAVAIGALARLSSKRGPELMMPRLDDPDPRIRAAAVQCVVAQGQGDQVAAGEEALQDLLTDGDPTVRMEAAKVLGALPEPTIERHVIGLLFDSDKRVVRAMVVALRQRLAKAAQSPMYVPILISLLRDRRLKHEARETLVAYGREVLPALSHFLNDDNEQLWVRRAIPKTLVSFSGRGAAAVLYECLESCGDPMQRSKVIEALTAMPNHQRDQERLRTCLHEMALSYFENVFALDSLMKGSGFVLEGTHLRWLASAGGHNRNTTATSPGSTAPSSSGFESTVPGSTESLSTVAAAEQPLVLRLLEENRQSVLRDIAALIGLLLPGVELGELFDEETDKADRRRVLSQAVEYLDNVLDGRLRDELLLVLDEVPLDRRLEQAHEHFAIPRRTQEQTLAHLLRLADGHEVQRWLAAAAAYRIGELRLQSLYPAVAALAEQGDENLVGETAQHVMERMIA